MAQVIRRFPADCVSPPVAHAVFQSLLTRIFGCHHREMSRPLTTDDDPHRECLNCGARRRFDTKAWKMVGPFYFDSPSNRAAK